MSSRYFDHGDSYEDLTMRFCVPKDGAGKPIPHLTTQFENTIMLLVLPSYERRIPMGFGGLNKVTEMYSDFGPLFHRSKLVLLVNDYACYVKKNRLNGKQYCFHLEELKNLDALIEGCEEPETLLDPLASMSFVPQFNLHKLIENSSVRRRKYLLLT